MKGIVLLKRRLDQDSKPERASGELHINRRPGGLSTRGESINWEA